MSQQDVVYDLGVVDAPGPAPDARQRVALKGRSPERRRGFDSFADSLELFAPGAGQLCRRRWSDGLFGLSVTGFILATAWAVTATLDRLPDTLTALDWPAEAGIYVLTMLYVGLGAMHTANLLCATSRGTERAHPAAAALASGLFPGWGQLLNRQPVKATLFVAGLWVLGAFWLLAAPRMQDLFAAHGVTLAAPAPLDSPWVLGGASLGLWLLALVDAVFAARR